MPNISICIDDIKSMVSTVLLTLNEGITFGKNGDKINGTIDSLATDIANKDFDTRLFGSKGDILYGDGTNKRQRYLSDVSNAKNSLVKTYRSLIQYVKNGRKGEIYTDEFTPKATLNDIRKKLQDNTLSDDEIIRLATRNISKQGDVASIYGNTYNRINSLNDNEKGERYLKGVVPGTNVELISLFTFKDFNVSDFIKNGNFRQNDVTDKIMGIDKSQRQLVPKLYGAGNAQQEKIKATYDNGITPDLYNNFSLSNGTYDTDHFGRVRRDYADKNYTSISKFQDKSIMYASYVLKKEGIRPDFIVAAPSSSNFNNNYCIRLSDKTGVEYVPDFFKRNVVNVVLDKDNLSKIGLTEEKVNDIEHKVLSVTYSEISDKISIHMKQFFKKYENYFTNINSKKYAREKTDIRIIQSFVVNYSYEYLFNVLEKLDYVNDALSMTILNNLSFGKQNDKINALHLKNQIAPIIESNPSMLRDFSTALNKMAFTMIHFRKQLLNGYKPNFESKKFKITDFDDMVRPYLKNCYVIADSELSSKNGNELFSKYKGAKFLVFDEDIQSGGTLKLLIQCMRDKFIPSENITCLVQAYGKQ